MTPIVHSFFGENVHVRQLKCGLTVYLMSKPYFSKKYAFLSTQFGGFYHQYEYDGERFEASKGVAHFLEHQIFESQGKSHFEKFEALGASLNAYTSSTSTVYHFDTTENYETCLKMLVDMVFNIHITDESVEKERGIIIQEIKMYMDEPEWDLNTNLMNGLYQQHPIKEDIAGTVESVQNTTKDEIIRCYEHFYQPSNMSLFLYGDFDLEQIYALTEKLFEHEFSCVQCVKQVKPTLILPEETSQIGYLEKTMVKDVSLGMVMVGFKGNVSYFNENRYRKLGALKIANDLMFGRSSHFFKTSYDAGIVFEGFDFDIQVGDGYAMAVIGNETDHQQQIVEGILDTISYYQKNGFEEADFVRMKRKIMGRTVASFNSLQSIANNYTHLIMRNSNLFEQLESYKDISLDEVNQCVKAFYDLSKVSVSKIVKKDE